MQPADAFFLARTAEHIVVAVIGLFIAWMGYWLFREMPVQREGEAKIGLPGGISIYFSRVGPGAFFVLFGAGLIGYTATRPVTLQQAPEQIALSGFGERSVPPGTTSAPGPVSASEIGLPRPGLVRTLAEVAAENDATPLSSKQIERAAALREARIEIMLAGWDPKWGSRQDFRRWAENMQDPPPETAVRAAQIFNGK